MIPTGGHKPEHLHWHIFKIDILFLQTKQSTWMSLFANTGVKLSHTTYKNCSKHLSYATSKTNYQNCSLDDERWWQVGADATVTQPINFQSLNPSAMHRLTMWVACPLMHLTGFTKEKPAQPTHVRASHVHGKRKARPHRVSQNLKTNALQSGQPIPRCMPYRYPPRTYIPTKCCFKLSPTIWA